MAGHSLRVAREIKAPPERVWDIITDLDHAPDHMSGIVAIERVEVDGYEVGTRWRETRRMFGREETEEMWVSAIDPLRSTTVKAESRGTEYVTVFTLEPTAVGTRITMDFNAETPHPGPAQRIGWLVFGKAGMKATEKAIAKDLEDIAAVAEGGDDDAMVHPG